MPDRYLFLINSLAQGGAERSLVEMLGPLRDSGVEPVVVCLQRSAVGFEDEVDCSGFDLRFLSARRLPGRVVEMRRLIRELEPALVHTTLFDSDLVGRLAAAGLRTPVVTTLANTTYEKERIEGDANLSKWKVEIVRFVDGMTARHLTDHFHAVSHAVKESSVRALGIEPDLVTVVHRGRDIGRLGSRDEARRAQVRAGLGIGDDVFLVLNVGRHEFQKNQVGLIRALRVVAAEHAHVRLLIAGREGNATEALESEIVSEQMDSKVTLLGHRSDIPDLLAAADLFVFPSLWEGLGGAVLEALGAGIPIVASDLPAIREVLVDGGNGILVEPGDVPALAAAVERMITDSEMRDALVGNNRDRFIEMFGIEEASRGMLRLFQSVNSGDISIQQ